MRIIQGKPIIYLKLKCFRDSLKVRGVGDLPLLNSMLEKAWIALAKAGKLDLSRMLFCL